MFQPIVPIGGVAGWKLLERTQDRQLEAFVNSPEIKRNIDHFRENAGKINTIDEFFADRRVLEVALGAYGLQDEIFKTAYLQKVVSDGVFDDSDFANRLTDKRFAEFAQAVGFGDGVPYLLKAETVREKFITRYIDRAFEVSLGNVDQNMRLASNFKREIAEIASDPSADTSGWFKVLGRSDLRAVLDGALGMPSEFAGIDVDQQRAEIESRMASLIGSRSPTALNDPANVDKLIQRFLFRAEAEAGPNALTPGATALTLLQSSSFSGAGGQNLFQSLL
ncbi:MAG: DUF1217 domain-containing protein [Pseudomonadota bacterium]